MAVSLSALLHISGIAALERFNLAAVDLPGQVANGIQKPAVVGNNQQTATAAGPANPKVLGQPCNTFNVKVVGWFIKHYNVVLASQQCCQGNPSTLPTRE